METTRYIIYEKMYNNTQINIKIRGIYNDKNVAKNKFNELKKILPDICINTDYNFHNTFNNK
jgi:hypothetical protein